MPSGRSTKSWGRRAIGSAPNGLGFGYFYLYWSDFTRGPALQRARISSSQALAVPVSGLWNSSLSPHSCFTTIDLRSLSSPPFPLAALRRASQHIGMACECQMHSLGQPPAGTTIDPRVSLKPHHENALTDALYEVSNPRHPKYVHLLLRKCCTHVCRCSCADTAHISPRSRSLNSPCRTMTRSSLSTPGLNTTAFPPRLSQ